MRLIVSDAVLRPGILSQALPDRLLGGRRDCVEGLSIPFHRPAEQDEALVHQRVHEPGVLLKSFLLAQVFGEVVWATALETDGVEGGGHLAQKLLPAGWEGIGHGASSLSGLLGNSSLMEEERDHAQH